MSTGTKARSEFQQGKQKQAKSPKPKRPCMPTKIGLHAFHINLYWHEFFEPILFFDPRGLQTRCPWPKREI